MSQVTTTPKQSTPPRQLQARVRKLVDEHGLAGASERLGLSRLATASLAGGLRVQQGTLMVAEARAPR
jgi:hypothetical protein